MNSLGTCHPLVVADIFSLHEREYTFSLILFQGL